MLFVLFLSLFAYFKKNKYFRVKIKQQNWFNIKKTFKWQLLRENSILILAYFSS